MNNRWQGQAKSKSSDKATSKASTTITEQILLAVLMLSLALMLCFSGWLWRWDKLLYDLQLRFWNRPADSEVVIVAIDDLSLETLGHWPWSRHIHANLIASLSQAGAHSIGWHVGFTSSDLNNPAGDDALIAAVSASKRVILPIMLEQHNQILREKPPFPQLVEAAAGLGHVDMELDPDGIARGVYLRAGLVSPKWPSLALAMLGEEYFATLPGERNQQLEQAADNRWVRDYWILVPFAGPPDHFLHVSYIDVLRGNFAAGLFKDKYVIVGATAAGLGETLTTPRSGLGKPMAAPEVSANILATLRSGLTIQPLDLVWQSVLTGLLALLPIIILARAPPRRALLITGVILGVALMLSIVLLRSMQLWFAPMSALLTIVLSYLVLNWRHLEKSLNLLHEQKQQVQVTLHSIADAVISSDLQGRIEYLNPAAENLLDTHLPQVKGQMLTAFCQLIDEQTRQPLPDLVRQCLQQRTTVHTGGDVLLVNLTTQRQCPVRVSVAPMYGLKEQLFGVVLVLSDMTEPRRMTQQIIHQATHDALTGLPNRVLLLDRLQQALNKAKQQQQQLAVLFLDLDHFKVINDSLGHSAGDNLLRVVAARLRQNRRASDTVARIGGDEFVFVLEDIVDDDVIASITQQLLHTLQQPFAVDKREFLLSGSIGISLFPRDGDSAEALLKSADTAMYWAKDSGRNRFQFFIEQMNSGAVERLELEQELRRAIEQNRLQLYYQPQVELSQGKIIGVEALLRWWHPRLGLIEPQRFIPVAEDTGLILALGEWAMQTACDQAVSWQTQGLPPLQLSINLSPRQFNQPDLVQRIDRILHNSQFTAQSLVLEITESVIMQDLKTAVDTLAILKAMGVKLAIDDFGTGHSSLSYLKQFPIDTLKIDRSFIRDLVNNPQDAAIVEAVISLARNLGLNVIAEGVETHTQLTKLRQYQCQIMQGYLCSPPLPASEFTTLLQHDYIMVLTPFSDELDNITDVTLQPH